MVGACQFSSSIMSSCVRSFGAERLSQIDVAFRVNQKLWQQQNVGSVVRVGGHLRGDTGLTRVLSTTDGGEIEVVVENTEANKTLLEESGNMGSSTTGGFVEVVGTKINASSMSLVAFQQFTKPVDVELYDGSIMAMHAAAL